MSQFMEILSLEKNGKKKSKTGTKKWEMEWKYRSLNAYHIVPSKFTRQVLSHHSMKLRPRRVKELDQVQFSRSVVSDSLQPHEPQHARPPYPSITNSRSLPKLMSIEAVMPSNHLILCHPLLLLPSIFPNIRVFSVSQLFSSGGQNIRVSALASVPPMNTQDWSPLGWTG